MTDMTEFTVTPIGHVRSSRQAAIDDFWGAVEATITLDARFGPEALYGLADFSHVEVLFLMDGSIRRRWRPGRGIRASAATGRSSASSRSAARDGRIALA